MAVVERPVTGEECKLYYNDGTYTSPTWVEIHGARNVSYSLSKSEADQGSRRSKCKKDKGTQKALEFTFSYRKKQGTDAVCDVLIAAALSDTVYEYAVLDGESSTSGVQGPRAFCEIFTADGTQDLESAEEVEFTLKPTYMLRYEGIGDLLLESGDTLLGEGPVEGAPEWYEVA